MATNGAGNPGRSITVLYKVVNAECDKGEGYNAFHIPRGAKGPTLALIKQKCVALYGMNHMGPDGYHWRVAVEEKMDKSLTWWDIQDENATLPIKEATAGELAKIFSSKGGGDDGSSSSDSATKAAKGAFKSLGKAMLGGAEEGPPVPIMAFKLLDLAKMHDDFSAKHGGGTAGHIPHAAPRTTPRPSSAPRPAARPAATPAQRAAAPRVATVPRPTARAPAAPSPAARAPAARPAEASLMDFGDAPSASVPTAPRRSQPARPNETRAEKLKREYKEKNATSNRIWDDVDQRWVEVDPKASFMASAASIPPTKKEVGISLDPSNAVGKSANVQAAVNKRVNEMRDSQAKALQEVREREERKKADDAAEDVVRKRLEPRIKQWSEEHGKKKQLSALLASLHTILWPEANWKQVSIGDLLDKSKLKKCFHKASRVVHPDKTHHLDPEKRFLAKRIFDALSQAKKQLDEGK